MFTLNFEIMKQNSTFSLCAGLRPAGHWTLCSHIIVLTLVFLVFDLSPTKQCQAQGMNSTTNSTNITTTTSTTTPTRPTTKRPNIVGGICHYCDLCDSPLTAPDPQPPLALVRACAFTDNSSVRCMTKSKVHSSNNGVNTTTHIDNIRGCLQNGTEECMQDFIGISPKDGKCFKTTVPYKSYEKYLNCDAAARREEWEKIKGQAEKNSSNPESIDARASEEDTEVGHTFNLSNSTKEVSQRQGKPVESNTPVEVTICACMGALCNTEKTSELEGAEIVEGLRTTERNRKNGGNIILVQQHSAMIILLFIWKWKAL